MTPAGTLSPQDWMTAPETRAVVAALTAGGAEVRFVGGCVRDAVAGRLVRDIDLATADPPERVIALLESAGLKAVPTGVDHGTVTAVAHGRHFEVTTLREDVETFGRRARVAFTDDWTADAARRDLTINALSCTPDGKLYDPFGGLDDLRAGRVRFVGAARERITEDYLRLLRFFRFHAHYGRGALDAEGLVAASELAPGLSRLSGERMRDELLRLLAAPDPVPVIDVMVGHAILAAVLPEAAGTAALRRLLAVEAPAEAVDALRRLAALLRPERGAAEAVAERLRLSRAQAERLVALAERPDDVASGLDPPALRRALYRHGKARIGDHLLLDWARNESIERAALERDLAAAGSWTPVVFPLKGRDALRLGIARGPEVGSLLARVEAWWIEQDFRPDRAACIERLRSLIESDG